MISRDPQCRAIRRPLFFALNSYWKNHLILYVPMVNNHLGVIFQCAMGHLYGFYRTLQPHTATRLPGGFKNPNHFCFGHALFQVLFASGQFSRYFSPSQHKLKPRRSEDIEQLTRRQKIQKRLNKIRQKIYSHETVEDAESYRLRHEFHLVNREIPEEGGWDLCEFSDNVFKIIQTPPLEFSLDILPIRYNASSFYLNPNLLEKSEAGKKVAINSIPLLSQKIKPLAINSGVVDQLPKITLGNILLNPRKTPGYFSVQISRFNMEKPASKRKNFIQLKDIYRLSFRLIDSPGKVDYQLIGSCEHEGTGVRGHYYSIIRYPDQDAVRWIKCDSSSISFFNANKLNDIVGRKGCFYFYERVS
jgi:hypothetical protein